MTTYADPLALLVDDVLDHAAAREMSGEKPPHLRIEIDLRGSAERRMYAIAIADGGDIVAVGTAQRLHDAVRKTRLEWGAYAADRELTHRLESSLELAKT